MTVVARVFAAAALTCATVLAVGGNAHAAGRPQVRLGAAVTAIGSTVDVTVSGFAEQSAVTVTLCGNQARRGTTDCALGGSQGLGITGFAKEHSVRLAVVAPPVPCPCVVQVANATQSEVAYAPIEIAGFPTAPVTGDNVAEPLVLRVQVMRAPQGPVAWLRSFVGGPTPYDVEVVMENLSPSSIQGLDVVARGPKNLTVGSPDALAAGESWRRSTRVTAPAPNFGGVQWTVTAAADGLRVESTAGASLRPIGFYFLMLVLIADVGFMVIRRHQRSARSRSRYLSFILGEPWRQTGSQ